MFSLNYRPSKFSEMVGHASIIKEMTKSSIDMSYPQVMLFEGATGTGKTTLALIIAALLTDRNPLKNDKGTFDPNPDSPSTKSIRDEKFNRDVYMFDASSMGKDDVAGIEDLLGTAPLYDPKKVVIIDEAQELTKAGKGVTLKLLEKKRKNVHLILCTMNIDAFDKAVKSRGQQYKFKPVSSSDIASYLFNVIQSVGKLESIPEDFLQKGLFTIAENSAGSVRQAVQCLERVLNSEIYTEEAIRSEFGFISEESQNIILNKLLLKDGSALQDMEGIELKEFFYKTYKILMTAAVYSVSGYVKESWQEASAKKLMASPNLVPLLEAFSETDNGADYFKPSLFQYKLFQYLRVRPNGRVPV